MEYISCCINDTISIAKKLADNINGNEIILIAGELGAGKTTFTKALAKELGVVDLVTSPTFAFMREYFGRCKLSHFDMYRAENEEELFELGLSDNLYEDGVCVIEWNKFTQFPLDKCIINIQIFGHGDTDRVFNITSNRQIDV